MEPPGVNEHPAWDMAGIVRTYEPRLTRYALHLVGDLDAARDVVQETFVALWRAEPARVADAPGAWLFTVCRRRALDLLRKERPMDPLDSAAARAQPAPGPAPEALAERLDDRERLLAGLLDLPAKQQEVLRLKFHGQLSYREISQVTGLTESYVGVLLHAAMLALREQLRETDAETAPEA